MSMSQLSDYVFMGSLIILIVAVFVYGGSSGIHPRSGAHTVTDSSSIIDLQLDDKRRNNSNYTKSSIRIIKAPLFWIGILGTIVSIILTKF